MERASRYPGVALVLDGSSAALRYNLPPEREGDFIVTGDAHTVLGSRVEEHELGGLKGHRLRSHGGLSEQSVPFIVSRPLKKEYQERAAKERLRNFDIFDFVLNGSVDRE
jgi:phosphonoacetate hydrolase